MIQRIKTFFEDSRAEFKHINWPTFAETRRLTFIVIGLSLGIAALLGFLDFIFTDLLNKFFLS
jgi:preprotein translocase subunit SecE